MVSIFPSGYDIEGTSLEFIITEEPEYGNVALVSWFFSYTPDNNFNGNDSFKYVAYDGESYSDEATINITITPDNDPPTLATIDNQIINEGENFFYSIIGNDIDGDPLSYSFSIDQIKQYQGRAIEKKCSWTF